MFDLLVQFLTQVGGGPGPAENNLVRFALPALFWAVLFVVAWSRQREEKLPRERLLLFGFALAFAREFFMFLHTFERLYVGPASVAHGSYIEPLEHALAVSAVLVISAAFIRYILDDAVLPRRFLLLGIGAVVVGIVISLLYWPAQHTADPSLNFHNTAGGWFMHITKAIFVAAAIFILLRHKGPVRNLVIVALSFLLVSVILTLINTFTSRAYGQALCPIANNLHIWAVPIFGFVYFHEQSSAKKQAEQSLAAYRGHLEQLVGQRTSELSTTNRQLQREIAERTRAEAYIAQRNAQLSAQNQIAATISKSLNLDEVLHAALEQTIDLLQMDGGCIMLLDAAGNLTPHICCRARANCAAVQGAPSDGACLQAAWRALRAGEPVIVTGDDLARGRSAAAYDSASCLLLSAPLVAHGEALGALTMSAAAIANISEQQLAILTAVGQQIGVAVENGRLYQEAEGWAQGMSRLHEISLQLNATLEPAEICCLIVEQAAALLDCSAAGLFRLDEEGQTAVGVASYGLVAGGVDGMRLSVTESANMRRLLAGGDPLVVEDVRSDARFPPDLWQRYPMRAVLGVPVRGTGDIQGVLFLVESTDTRQWQAAEIRLLLNFTNRAGVAWENAYLHKQLEWAAALQERQRIAAEMHDGLAQTISMLALRNDQAAQLLEDGKMAPALLELAEIQDIIGLAGVDLRRSIASLARNPRPRCSLQEALDALLHNDLNGQMPPIRFDNGLNEPLILPPEQLDQIVPIVQEALLNAARHAQAAHLTVRLQRRDDCCAVSIADDGRGFEIAAASGQPGNHFGLSIMRARAQRIGGTIEIESLPDRGTCVLLTWPAPQENPHGAGPQAGMDAGEKSYAGFNGFGEKTV